MVGEWDFEPVPTAMVDLVRAQIPAIVRSIIAAIGVASPVYGTVLDAPEGLGIRLGIEQAVRAFLDAVEQGAHPAFETDELWRRLGESEFEAGRELDGLRDAFRTGARAAWRNASDAAIDAGLPTTIVLGLAEAIFVYTEELGSDAVEGYLRVQSDEAGELERRRRRITTLLLDPAGVDLDALTRAAALARWPMPRALAVMAVDGQSPGEITRRLGTEVLVGSDADGVFLVIPDPEGPGRADELSRAGAGQPAALGPTVGVREAARSLRWARWLLTLALGGQVGWVADDLARSEDHLGDLILLRDPELAAALVRRRLGVLEALPASERDRLEETLEAWLAHQRHTPSVARELNVHPQTVRYRVTRLRELIGEPLDTVDGRFELGLALRALSRGRGHGRPR